MSHGLHIRLRTLPSGVRTLTLSGEADLDTADALRAALDQALAGRPAPQRVEVHCSALGFCSSSGLNELLRARRAALAQGTAFCLTAPSSQLLRLLELTRTTLVFDLASPDGLPSP
ncbi:hypothetical protein CFP65_7130 [Kitasatospora sp. MMS16-BH015]|uniref:STAS domain-containing protein n=1 Tax=Kitasatospora sp. MMS16-BH015 TaxID=2018025 RepID=UPI000CA32CB0|nr:STAS domain-containing protein [Kitasatospora sp. MMS16-BH015]AUG81730.1 hypothetical protein CFP65_7130 [Kitasatospora sp. MMS16-BH015]